MDLHTVGKQIGARLRIYLLERYDCVTDVATVMSRIRLMSYL